MSDDVVSRDDIMEHIAAQPDDYCADCGVSASVVRAEVQKAAEQRGYERALKDAVAAQCSICRGMRDDVDATPTLEKAASGWSTAIYYHHFSQGNPAVDIKVGDLFGQCQAGGVRALVDKPSAEAAKREAGDDTQTVPGKPIRSNPPSTWQRQWGHLWQIPCTSCGAAIDESCYTKSGVSCLPHQVRFRGSPTWPEEAQPASARPAWCDCRCECWDRQCPGGCSLEAGHIGECQPEEVQP